MKKTFEQLLETAPAEVLELLEGLKGLRERPDYHPESSAAEHVNIVTTRLLEFMTGLFHDLFKEKNARINEKNGFPTSPDHDIAAAHFIRESESVQKYIESHGANPEIVAWLCEQHMRIKCIGEMSNKKRWALMRNEWFEELCLFAIADRMLFNWDEYYEKWNNHSEKDLIIGDVTLGWLIEQESLMKAEPVKVEHRMSGAELIAMGYPQGKVIGVTLKMVDEKYSDTPIEEVKDILAEILDSPSEYIVHEDFGLIAGLLKIADGSWTV